MIDIKYKACQGIIHQLDLMDGFDLTRTIQKKLFRRKGQNTETNAPENVAAESSTPDSASVINDVLQNVKENANVVKGAATTGATVVTGGAIGGFRAAVTGAASAAAGLGVSAGIGIGMGVGAGVTAGGAAIYFGIRQLYRHSNFKKNKENEEIHKLERQAADDLLASKMLTEEFQNVKTRLDTSLNEVLQLDRSKLEMLETTLFVTKIRQLTFNPNWSLLDPATQDLAGPYTNTYDITAFLDRITQATDKYEFAHSMKAALTNIDRDIIELEGYVRYLNE